MEHAGDAAGVRTGLRCGPSRRGKPTRRRRPRGRRTPRATTSGVTSAMPSTVRDASASASGAGGKARIGTATTAIPAACAERIPLRRVLDRDAPRRVDAEPPRDLEVDVGRGLAARRPPRWTATTRMTASRPAPLEHERDHRRVRGRREPERPLLRRAPGPPRPRRAAAAARGGSRRPAARRPRRRSASGAMSTPSSSRTYTDHSVELIPSIACVRLVGPRPAAVGDELAARLVPALLGVDEHAVEVEDDRVGPGHGVSPRARAAGAPRGSGRRGRRPRPRARA